MKAPAKLPPDRPLADRRGRSLGSRSSRALRSGDPDDHRAGRRNRLRRSGGRAGCEEGDEVDGEGTAALLDDGTIEIEFEYRNGDEAVLKAKRDTSSTAC